MASMLSFAGFEDFEVESADVPQQFAEKIHAMTRPWEDRDNTRVKDLADVVLFIKEGLDPDAARTATIHVFSVRDTHPIPDDLPDPPPFWNEDYPRFAEELGLDEATLDQAMETLRRFWRQEVAQEPRGKANNVDRNPGMKDGDRQRGHG